MIFTAPGIKGTLEQFIIGIERTIGGDQNKAKGLVFGAAALLREFSEQSLMIDDKITPWSVGTVLLTALRFVTDEPIMPDSDSKCIGFRDEAYQLAEQAEGLVPQVLLQDSPPRSAHLQNFVWYMYAGQVIQGDIGHRIATALILTGLCGFNNLAKNPNPTHELFSNLGVDAFEYFTLMYCVSVMTSESMFANADQFLEKSPRADRLKPCLMAVFEEAGISWQRKMRNEQLRFAQDFEGKAHAMAILTRYPLVMMSPNRVMLLGVPFLRSHGAEKFVTKCQQLARKKYGRPSNIYTSEFLGIRFEKFFFELCDIWRPGQHFGDFKYYIGKNECKAPDRIVFESKKSREHAVFFQQKCRFLGEESVAGTECKTIREEIKKSCVETILKSVRFLYAALNETISTDDKVLQDVFLRIRGARTFTLVGIYPSIPPFLTIKDFRDMLISEVKTQLSEDQLKWFTHNLNRTIFWHVIDLEEFLTFMTIPKIKRHFAYELRRYILEMKFDEYIFVERKPPLNFRSYLLYRHPVSNGNPRFRQSGMLPELAISFNEGFQIIKDILGWKENAGSETLT